MPLRYVLFSGVLWLQPKPLQSQVYTNDAGTREKQFIYEVKQIDEFFERFNDAPNSFIRDVYKKRNMKFTVSRQKLVRSLFNYETNTWNPAMIDSFVHSTVTTASPKYLDFASTDWYAELNCQFYQRTEVIGITLILRITKDQKEGFRWTIAGAGENNLPISQIAAPADIKDDSRFINPASHGNDFIALGEVLNDTKHLSVYFDRSFFSGKYGPAVYDGIRSGALRFHSVRTVKYHFLQISNWIFTTEYFNRRTLNSGWLINSLVNANDSQKADYRKRLLGDY